MEQGIQGCIEFYGGRAVGASLRDKQPFFQLSLAEKYQAH
jgi:hypothetical protein